MSNSIEQAKLGACIFCDNGQVVFTEECSQSFEGDCDSEASLVCSTKECPLNLIDESWYSEWASNHGWKDSEEFKKTVKEEYALFASNVDCVRECLLEVISKLRGVLT